MISAFDACLARQEISPPGGDRDEEKCDRYRIPWSGEPYVPTAMPSIANRHVDISGVRSACSDCGFRVVLERGSLLKQLCLGSTCRVEICQQFDALAGDELSYKYVILLLSGRTPHRRSALIDATLTHVDGQRSYSLLHHSVHGCGANEISRIASDAQQLTHFVIPDSGRNILRFTTAVDAANAGTRASLLVDDVQIIRQERTLATLASIGCAGTVRQ